jgi:deoxyribonuclease V
LGACLYEAIGGGASIVGVAKSRYRDTSHAIELTRGVSKRPLFITAIGMDYGQAARHIASMAGDFRIPSLLKAVDRLARTRPERP